jgi:hypothetical protein
MAEVPVWDCRKTGASSSKASIRDLGETIKLLIVRFVSNGTSSGAKLQKRAGPTLWAAILLLLDLSFQVQSPESMSRECHAEKTAARCIVHTSSD